MADLVFNAKPVLGWPISGGFGAKGDPYPVEGHRGVDYAAPQGVNVHEQAGGVVHAIHRVGDGWGDGSFGNMVVIDHVGTPWYSGYCHLSAFAVTVGTTIPAGTIVGQVGATGKVTGAHLHHQVTINDSFPANIATCADPLSFLKVSENATLTDAQRIKRLEDLVAGFGILGPNNRDGKPDLFGEAALRYATERQYSAILSGQNSGITDAEIVKQLLMVAANSASVRDDLIAGLTDLLKELENE
jgi:hypothetical protein